MTSEIDVLKTNEFLRRRKLRLQQVREQSKDIAKKIRQRAKVEKFRHVLDIDSKKEKEYFDCQEKLVKRLELLYSNGLQNVGASHKKALEVSQLDLAEKIDLSKLRGKEAVAEVRRRKQEKLDEQKKLLERKLQAREVANEKSREKSSTITKNLTTQTKKIDNLSNKPVNNSNEINNKERNDKDSKKDNPDVTKTDMGTQWESGEMPNEWEPNIPALSLPKDDTAIDTIENTEKSDKNKKTNLFALSDEMPSSLRGGLSSVPEEPVPIKPSLTLISEYLQNRNLRLRQFEPIKKPADDLQSIKQTILRTRSSRADGSVFNSICHVLDEQVIPVPSWHAEENLDFHNCQLQPNSYTYHVPKFPHSNFHDSSWSHHKHIFNRVPKLSFTNNELSNGTEPGNKDKSFRSTDPEVTITRKKSISVYNHNTRDIMDVPYGEKQFVTYDKKADEDAYAQALQETVSASHTEKEKLNKQQQDIRSKVAVTKQNVDKEYRDTLAFLNSLPKNKDVNHLKKSYMNDQRQQLQKDRHQRKMQQEFKKIERECHKHNCKHSKRKSIVLDKSRSKSKSPVNTEEQQRRDFEYSWMPVPESDGNFAIHTIPNTNKNKSGNTVKFSEPNSYHEYRSRHKHTPPTKDINDDRYGKKFVETVILQQNSNLSDESEISVVSETSSVENLNIENNNNVSYVDSKLRDADRIIIYKILDSRNKKSKNTKKAESNTDNNGKSTNSIENRSEKQKSVDFVKNGYNTQRDGSFEQIQEGVYKGVSSEGDNITPMYVSEDCEEGEAENQIKRNDKLCHTCCCGKVSSKPIDKDCQKERGDNTSRLTKPNAICFCGKNNKGNSLLIQPSEASSTASFKTAPNGKVGNINPDSEFIKLLDDRGHETGKFYIGASGFIKDENYEVIIQLRKKDGEKFNNQENKDVPVPYTTSETSNTLSTLNNKKNTEVRGDSNHLLNNMENNPIPFPNLMTNVETNKVVDINNDVLISGEQNLLSKEQSDNKITEPVTKSLTNNMSEKAVHTSFEDSYAVPVNLPKSDPLSRPATSTYTQTSFNSSIQRPVFMHMSSSTSTAYMSPPELVLPKFLKQDYIMTHDELFESENTVNQTDSQYEVVGGDCKLYKECKCKRCTEVKKDTTVNVKPKNKKGINTPPNTERSSHHCKFVNETKETKMRKCKCHKCRCSSETKICHKTCRKRTKSDNRNATRDYSYEKENKNMKVQSIKHQRSSVHTKDNEDNTINPVIKNYVNKLLALNREGLKAVEIMNQDCSVASTPGSSIINVPSNNNKQQISTENLENKISLEQIKNILKQQILKDSSDQCQQNTKSSNFKSTKSQSEKKLKLLSRFPKKKSVHKVKSLNISRQFLHKKKSEQRRPVYNSKIMTSTSSSTREEKKVVSPDTKNSRSRSRSSPTPRSLGNSEYKNSTSSYIAESTNRKRFKSVVKNLTAQSINDHVTNQSTTTTKSHQVRNLNLQAHKAKATYTSSDSEVPSIMLKHLTRPQSPANIQTQTNGSIDVETNFMKLAEDKLKNMEKIADLTEKCTKRLSNLAKVLEEVRRNKSLVYSQISTSDSASEFENKSDKNETSEIPLISCPNVLNQSKETHQPFSSLTIPANLDDKKLCIKDSTEYIPFLQDIPKPVSFVTPSSDEFVPINDKTTRTNNSTTDFGVVKVRGRPPPALSRINLKNGQDISVTPHELSTVIEVDSPMSVKLKNQSSRYDSKFEVPDKNQTSDEDDNKKEMNVNVTTEIIAPRIDPDLLQSNITSSKHQSKVTTDSSEDSKVQTLDLKQFNNIMLKPFITLQEYAKQCNVGLDEGSNVDVVKDDLVNEDLSSLHSDGSLPDVIAELLKRNIISEPFKFDTASNGNSTTMSSESTFSMLALSKSRKDKKKLGVLLKNKENIVDTSETLSISSNPDLENAFQRLGMGWASSTLKKTKERLALSSSSNTSSSSLAQFKIRTFNQVIPTLVTDSNSSLVDISNDHERKKLMSPSKNVKDNSKNALQQTSLTNSMTVKEFLTNELANKITFSNKSTRKEADEQFISLYETKMPEEIKNTVVEIQEDDEQSTNASNNIRARTSTPVQIFKSTTYNSTSSSNTSNGLFSNADDLSSVKVTSNSMRNHSTSDKDDLTIPNYSLKTRKELSDFSKSD